MLSPHYLNILAEFVRILTISSARSSKVLIFLKFFQILSGPDVKKLQYPGVIQSKKEKDKNKTDQSNKQ